MEVVLRCNNVSTHPAQVEVFYNGEKATATMPETEVELYDDKSQHGGIMLRYRGKAEVEKAMALFVPGQYVKLTMSAVPPENVSTEAEAEETHQ